VNCPDKEKLIMKKMLIAATVVGTAIAGIILFARKKSYDKKSLADANNTYQKLNTGTEKTERLGSHAMG
jgi:uncharacterized protein YxeA